MYGIGYSHGNWWGSAGGRPTGWGMYAASDGDIRVILDAENGIVWSSASTRSPIFYDSDNTGYYVDPAGTSNLNAANFAGNVGIGTTSPGYKLQVVGGDVKIGQSVGDNRKLYFGDGSGVWLGEDADEGLQIYTNYRTAIMGGNVGIGTTSPGAKLHVWSSSSGEGLLSEVTYSTARAIYGKHNTASGIGYGVYAYSISTNGYGLWCQAVNNSGGCSGNRAWSGTSDGRLKTNIVTIDNALEKVKKLRGVYFAWKNDPNKKAQMGFIAQETLLVAPEVINTGPDGYYTMQQGPLTALLMEAVKEQQNEIEILRNLQNENGEIFHSVQNDIKSVQNDIKFLLAMMGRFMIDENGTLTVKKVVTDELELGGYCVKVVEGKLSAEKGSCK